MQKVFGIVFSLLVLFQSLNIGVEDISKFSVLLEHAEYHQDTYGDSFFQFLGEHYGDVKDDHGNDHEEHEDLPFKHNHQSCVHASAAFTFDIITFNLNYESFIEIPFNFFYKESISLFERPTVFLPPKLA
ncbi:MAG: hypothetical protein V7719_00760 [Psychroserpens sp.]|uniref:hypothetical protein n=1 Tax=Psychroserpens sp. TaxID=2020870 RepID=UPI0030022815